MILKRTIAVALLVLALPACARKAQPEANWYTWQQPISIEQSVTGAFTAVLGDHLVIAGGTTDGVASLRDEVVLIPLRDAALRTSDRLPLAVANGTAVAMDSMLVLIGGDSDAGPSKAVQTLTTVEGELTFGRLPDLPVALAHASAAVLDSEIYVIGHAGDPSFFVLSLNQSTDGWRRLPLPAFVGSAVQSTVTAFDGKIYAFLSLASRTADESQTAQATFRFHPELGWSRLAKPPVSSHFISAFGAGASHLAVFPSSDEQRQASEVLGYDTVTNSWAELANLPDSAAIIAAHPYASGFAVLAMEQREGRTGTLLWLAERRERQGSFAGLDYFVLILYLVVLIWMGVFFSKRENSTHDFFLAGQRIPWWAAGLSIFSTQLSAITFMAIPAKAYATDWVYFWANMTIFMIAPLVIWVYLPFFRRLQLTTAYTYLEQRFDLATRWFGSIAYILLQFGRMAIVVSLPALALATVTGFNVYLCILIMGVLATFYTVLGGMEAVVWTDVIQTFVLLGGALVSVILMAGTLDGGLGAMYANASQAGKFHMFDWSWDYTITAFWVVIVGNIFSNLVPYTSDQTVIQRYLTTSDEAAARRAIWTNAVLAIPASLLFFGLGSALFVFYKAQPELLNPHLPTDAILPWFISTQLPAGVAGLVIAGLFAASMSSLDSSMNSVATAVVTDFVRRRNPQLDDGSALRLAKKLTIVVGTIGTASALLLVTFEIKSMLDVFLQILGLFGGSLAGLFMLGIFSKRAHARGALIGAITSAGVLYWVQRNTDVHFFLYAAIGIGSCVAIGYLLSLLLPGESRARGLTLASPPERR